MLCIGNSGKIGGLFFGWGSPYLPTTEREHFAGKKEMENKLHLHRVKNTASNYRMDVVTGDVDDDDNGDGWRGRYALKFLKLCEASINGIGIQREKNILLHSSSNP